MADQDEEQLTYEQLLEEENMEWWKPTKRDGFNLTNKLMRTGCRPVKRKYLNCVRQDSDAYENCQKLKDEMEQCVKMLKYIYATKPE